MMDRRPSQGGSAASAKQSSDEGIDVCESCFGTGTWMNPELGPILCHCQRSPDKRLVAARIPLRFRECLLSTYETSNESQRNALSLSYSLVEDYPGIKQGILFMGSVGVGKTHLAIGIMRALIDKMGVSCLFYESGSLLKTIQDSYSGISRTSELRVLAPVFEAEVLVLDELGANVPTDWVRDTMYQIINKRYNDKKLTIFTTNFPDQVKIERTDNAEYFTYSEDFTDRAIVANQYQKGIATQRRPEQIKNTTLEERIGTRLRSRLYEMCRQVTIEGQDFRKNIDQQ
jgi:DNA replication protein DnaC